ncbi:MAG: DUF427 domain-containing protein [Gammaproteobacteria bacterium]|nr:DUF427 domain-containing protein [Gammaproteobacteria bacterium]
MARAEWKGKLLAESDTVEKVEGNIYFPPGSLKREYFRESETTSRCFWKGKARYYDIEVDGEINRDAAWFYPEPTKLASRIKDHVAFWKGVSVSE